jgi:hypothetical protein
MMAKDVQVLMVEVKVGVEPSALVEMQMHPFHRQQVHSFHRQQISHHTGGLYQPPFHRQQVSHCTGGLHQKHGAFLDPDCVPSLAPDCAAWFFFRLQKCEVLHCTA